MVFRYTGSESFETQQPEPSKSLGGFVSSSVVPNGSLQNVFGRISLTTLQESTKEVRGLVLWNNTGGTVTNVRAYLEYAIASASDRFSKIEFAVVTLIGDGEQMEQIRTRNDEPYQSGSWIEPIGVGNETVLVASMENNTGIGVWFRRTITNSNPLSDVECEDLDTFYSDLQQNASEDVTLEIQWD
jgi:hypothetical protein